MCPNATQEPGSDFASLSDAELIAKVRSAPDNLMAVSCVLQRFESRLAPPAMPAYWLAVRDGQVNFGMSTDDGNAGGVARTEVNEWINDALIADPTDIHALVGFTPIPVQNDNELRVRVGEAIHTALGHAMDCTRVWEAWSFGTMTDADFVLVTDQEDRVDEIVSAAIDAIHHKGS